MGDVSQTSTALLTEHLQYTPLSLIDDIINSINTLVYQAISSLENGLTATPPARLGFKPRDETSTSTTGDDTEYPDANQEIEEGLHQLETLLESTVDRNFDKFEIYVLRNILSVPEDLAGWIRLSHYKDLPYSPPDKSPTHDSVHLLRRKVAESQSLRSRLLAEVSKNETIITQMKSLTTPGSSQEAVLPSQPSQHDLSFLSSTPSARVLKVSTSGYAHQPLTMNTNFALSQLPALQSLLAELRPRLADLRSSSVETETARAERREERREYIEERAKIHLERNGGDASTHSPTVIGKRLDPDEIEAVEKVADLLDTH